MGQSRNKKKTREQKKLEKRREKRACIHLLPTGQNISAAMLAVGIVCRGLVAAAAVFGIGLLLADAMVIIEEIVPYTALLIPSIIFAGAVTAMCVNKWAALAGAVLVPAGLYGWLALVLGQNPISYIGFSFQYFVNTVIDRISFAGLAELQLYKFSESYKVYDPTELMTVALAIFALLLSVLIVPATAKRVRMGYLAVLGVLFAAPIISYNIMRDNWGFSMFVVAYVALLALWVYDRKYLKSAPDKTLCTEMSALADAYSEADTLPTEEKRPEKKKKPRRPKGKDRDIEAALRLETPKQRRERKKTERRDAKSAKLTAKKQKREKKRAVKHAVSKSDAFRTAALGGPVGVLAWILAFLTVWLPTVAVKTSGTGIPYIDGLMDGARVYVTAFLSGSEIDLNDMGTIGVGDTGMRDVSVRYPEFNEIIVATVEAPYNTPVYLRTWIGETYGDNAWSAASVFEVREYRELFGDNFTPEQLTEAFYEAIDPSVNDISEYAGYRNNLKYGFITEKVSVTRTYGYGKLLYMPSTVLPSFGLMKYGDFTPSLLPHDAYYDGVWTSKYFVEGSEYSTVSNVASMKMPNVGKMMDNNVTYYVGSVDSILKWMQDGTEVNTGVIELLDLLYEQQGISFSGESIAKRFYTEMTDEEKDELLDSFELELLYRDYVYDTYLQTDPDDNSYVRLLAREILAEAVKDGAFGGDMPYFGDSNNSSGSDNRHEVIMTLISYLSENYEYRIEAPEEGEDTDNSQASDDYEEYPSTALIDFLYREKSGYCVQFASALTMMLRSLGIPARYCEGFIASEYTTDFHGNDDPLTRYKCDVYDSDAHAWVEVYYNHIGWVQYEATPPYLEAMYGSEHPDAGNSGSVDVSDPNLGTDTPDTPDTPDEPELPVPSGNEKLKKAVLIVAVSLAAIAIIGVTAWTVLFFRRAKKAREDRRSLIMSTSAGGAEFTEAEMHEKASELIKGIFAVYAALELLPQTGELTPEYTSRLAEAIGDASNITPEMLFETITAEEFGHGMSRFALARTSEYYSDLVSSVYDGLGRRDRFVFRYVKRIV